jgi:hypothetical protein
MKRLKWSGFSLSKTSCYERKLQRKEKLIMNRKHFCAAVILLSLLVVGLQWALAVYPDLVVEIDIKPGSYPNSINIGSHGLVPVAVLSSSDFDATTVDADSVLLFGSNLAIRGNGKKELAHEEDVNGDGLTDLVVQIETTDFDPGQLKEGEVPVFGSTEGGVDIVGYDEIIIVP